MIGAYSYHANGDQLYCEGVIVKILDNTTDVPQYKTLPADYFGLKDSDGLMIRQFEVCADGDWVALIFSPDNVLALWSMGTVLEKVSLEKNVMVCGFSPDSRFLIYGITNVLSASADMEVTFCMYDLMIGTTTNIPIYTSNRVRSCFVSPTNQFVGLYDLRTVTFWDLVTCERMFILEVNLWIYDRLHHCFYMDDKVVVGADKVVYLCELPTHQVYSQELNEKVVGVGALDSQYVCSGVVSEIIVWDVETFSQMAKYPTRRRLRSFANRGRDFMCGYSTGEVDFISFEASLQSDY